MPRSGCGIVRIDADTLTVALMDGRTISVPLAWFPRLLDATPAQRARWEPASAATASTGQTSTRT